MKLLVFDGNSIINRAFYAIKNLTTKDGMPTNAVFGFLKLYFKYFEMAKPDMVAVAFDVRAKTFRHMMYPEYKAQRHGMPDELAVQLDPLKEILCAMNVKMFACEGFEADDIIGTLSAYCEKHGYECDIVSGDRDDFQLISDKTRVIMPVNRGGMSEVEIYGVDEIEKKYGIHPREVVDLKAIMGDSSDNIRGVSGIGEKGALELIREFHSLKDVYENIESDKIKPAARKKLNADRESAFLSKELATIKRDVPIEISDDEMQVCDFDAERLLPLLKKYELTSIMNKLELEQPQEQTFQAESIGVLKAESCTDYFKERGLYFLLDDGKMYADTENGPAEISGYAPLLTDDTIKKFTFKPKGIYREILKSQPDVLPFYDIEVAQYVIDPSTSEYTLQDIFSRYIGMRADDNGLCVTFVSRMRDIVSAQLEITQSHGQHELLYNIEFPLTVVLADMENCGFYVDRAALERYSIRLAGQIDSLEKRIYFLAGEHFNINSPKQLGVILFEKLKLPHGKKTKSGYSTNAEILQKLSGKHEIVDEILEYRKYVKLKSTYCDGLLKLIGQDGKIHTSFNQTVTQTGRISSTEPNLQNIPVRTELGRELRAMFAADDDCVLVDADYSQIELRVLAHMANDEKMLDAFAREEDIHTVTASSVFNVPTDFVTPEMRRMAKAVNFGIVYGISDFSLAQDIKTTRTQARQYIDSYLNLYSGVRTYMKNVVSSAHKNGYVKTLFERRRYLPELESKNFNIRSFGERAAMNAPIQGTAADIIKIAMVNTRRALLDGGFRAKLILQVHDELIIEAPEEEKDGVCALLSREMENAAKLNVRLRADVQWGRTWYECK